MKFHTIPQENSFKNKQLLILYILIGINVFFVYFGLVTLKKAPILKIDQNTPFLVNDSLNISKIGSKKIDNDFFLRLPEFYNLERERNWWQMQNTIHNLLTTNQSIDIQYALFTGETYNKNLSISQATFSETLSQTFPIYLAGLLFLCSAISVMIKQHSEAGVVLSVFFCFCSLYLITAVPFVCRHWTLSIQASQLLINCHYIASGSLVSLVYYSMLFPTRKIIISQWPISVPVFFVLYVCFTSIMYIVGYWAFATTVPLLIVWILIMIVNFLSSIIKEQDAFIKKQITLSLVVPVLVGIFFAVLNSIPEILGSSSMQFMFFSLFSLTLPLSLSSAMDNMHLYQKQMSDKQLYNNEKDQFRQAIHDHTLSSLGHISRLSEKLLNDTQLPQIKKIGYYARTSANQIQNFLWIADENCSTWKEFCAFLRSYGYEHLEDDQIEFDFKCEIPESLKSTKPSIKIKDCLFQSFVEVITNINKHAHATKVSGQLDISHNSILLIITDNGRGASVFTNESMHLGLSGMEARATKFNGTLKITMIPDRGTTIRLVLPLNE